MTTTVRPIIMTADSVQGILAGRKRQTRRVVRPQPEMLDHGDCRISWGSQQHSGPAEYLLHDIMPRFGCPYGVPGDLLYCKEALRCTGDVKLPGEPAGLFAAYTADGAHLWDGGNRLLWQWKGNTLPAWFMRRRFARHILRLDTVRVQRVQEISEDDARKEGVFYVSREPGFPEWRGPDGTYPRCAYEAYASIWDTINAKRGYPWSANPWVFALTFTPLSTTGWSGLPADVLDDLPEAVRKECAA